MQVVDCSASFWDEKGREKMGWSRSPHVLEVVRYPWPMATCFGWFTWLTNKLHFLYCIVLFCGLDYSDPKILKVCQSCHLICILRQALLPQTNQQLSATLNWWSTTPDAFARAEVESHIIQIICMTGCSMFVHRAAGQMDKLDTLDWVHASINIDLCWNSWNYLKHKAVLVNRQGPLCLLPMGSITGCMLRHQRLAWDYLLSEGCQHHVCIASECNPGHFYRIAA